MATIRDQLRVAFRAEGTDHINISQFSKAEVGRLGTTELRRRFFIPHLGDFGSPRCFANWLASGGNDELRFCFRRYDVPKSIQVLTFRQFLMFGKFYQILALRNAFAEKPELLDLPWVMYRQHLTGVKEFDRWEKYPEMVKTMVKHIVSKAAADKFDWNTHFPGLVNNVNHHVREIAVANGTDPNEVVDILEAPNVARERKRQAAKNARGDRPEAPAMAPAEMPAESTAAEAQPAQAAAAEAADATAEQAAVQ